MEIKLILSAGLLGASVAVILLASFYGVIQWADYMDHQENLQAAFNQGILVTMMTGSSAGDIEFIADTELKDYLLLKNDTLLFLGFGLVVAFVSFLILAEDLYGRWRAKIRGEKG